MTGVTQEIANKREEEKRDGLHRKVPVIELFGPTIQGEGALAGQVSYFLRLGGCSYRCTWCDSMHAVDPQEIKKHAKMMLQGDILEWLEKEVPERPKGIWLTLTGGDPVMWDLTALMTMASMWGMQINVETQGALYRPWLKLAHCITCSPKGPSSGMQDKIDWKVLETYYSRLTLANVRQPPGMARQGLIFKVVIFDKRDIDFAELIHSKFPLAPMYLSAGTPTEKDFPETEDTITEMINTYQSLARMVLSNPRLYDCIIGMQSHVLLYGREKGR